MAKITPDELWQLVVETRLCSPRDAAALRAEHKAAAAASGADAKAVAAWLVEKGVLTRWQAKRVAIGDEGPFFYGDYRLLERHDRDGEAFEFTARHEPSGRIVCVVLMGKKQWRDPTVHESIVRRMTIATQAADPLLVRTWALEEADGRPVAVCEEVRGEPLADEVARRGPLPIREAGEIALAVARAVAELHAAGEVHGGISLDALLREPPGSGGRLRLRQFPLATDPHQVPPRALVATEEEMLFLGRRAAFVAPELVSGGACDRRSDVYALGCLLQSLVTGAAPHWQGDAREALDRAAGPRPGVPDPSLPPPLARLVAYMTARDPQDRYPDAAEAARAIATCFGFLQPELAAVPSGPAVPTFAFDFDPEAVAAVAGPAPRVSDPRAARAAATDAARRRGRRLRFLGGAFAGAILALAAVVVIIRTTPPPRPVVIAPAGTRKVVVATPDDPPAVSAPERPRPAAEPDVAPSPAAERKPELVGPTIVDDDTLPWEAPTPREPLVVAYLPEGSQLIVSARPAALLADEEGALFVRSLGPRVEAALAAVADACGCAPADIETLQAGWQADGTEAFVVGWVARLVAGKQLPATNESRVRLWGPGTPAPAGGQTIHAGPAFSYWAPTSAGGRVLVAAPDTILAEIVAASTVHDPPLLALPPDLERLVETLDGTRHLTVVGSPFYLLNSGRSLLSGPLEPVADGIEALLGESVQAAALSAHCGDDFYVELDAVATVDLPATALAARLAERIASYPAAAKAFCAARDLHPYGRQLVMELPTMVRILAANVRSGPEGKVAVVNARLPRHAGHNIALATELVLAQAAGGVASAPAAAVPAAPQGLAGRLEQKMTLEFAKDTLEKSIQMISEEIGVPMEIVGTDLQLDGITKNQSFALSERNKPAGDILRVILAKANPDGKLVYVIRTKDGVEGLEITTRAAVAKRGDELPAVFRQPGGAPQKGTK